MFATYVKSVNSRSQKLKHRLAHTSPPRLAEDVSDVGPQSSSSENKNSESPVGIHSSASEAAMLKLLETVKQNAMTQSNVLATEVLDVLAYKGYTLKDLAVWHWILLGITAEDAAARLELALRPAHEANADLGPVPIFVFNKLLLRDDISAEALSVLIRQVWLLLDLGRQESSQINVTDGTDIPRLPGRVALDVLITTVVRLLEHSRKVWSAACSSIAELWAKHAKDVKETSSLSLHYNRILHYIALPPKESPYRALRYRQRAQFVLIRRMNTFKPPLMINREGYRSVALVQLAHRKTEDERKWASLKALSWPPWKEDKLGIDAHIGVEYGISRASNVLRQAAERGYGPSEWERAAEILAGWDTDTSPTIQTRSLDIPIPTSSSPRGMSSVLDRTTKEPKLDLVGVWAARIKATRTFQEAWISFLACKDQGTPMSHQLYQVMIEKVVYDEKRKRGGLDVDAVDDLPLRCKSHQPQIPLPGDGKEVAEPSVSHNQVISSREPLPTLENLLERMDRDGVRPNGRLLELLLTHARSFDEGVNILQASPLSTAVKSLMILGQEEEGEMIPMSEAVLLLKSLPEWLFAAYISFLCRFSDKSPAPSLKSSSMTPSRHAEAASTMIETNQEAARRRLRHAFRLVATRRPFYRPPWNSLLRALSNPSTTVVERSSSIQQGVLKYDRACLLLRYLDSIKLGIDFTGLGHFCRILKNANASARHILKHGRYRERTRAQAVLEAGADIVKTQFARLVRPTDSPFSVARLSNYIGLPVSVDSQPALPRLLQVPHPVHLHLYIRCLGQHGDFKGLIEFMRWLPEFANEIIEEAKETANGMKMFTRCFVALRVLEHNDYGVLVEETRQEYESTLENLREAIDIRDDWGQPGGWPTDEDVDDYIHKGEEHTHDSMAGALLQNDNVEIEYNHTTSLL
ncbi:MAG: hypothetical protein Q9186_002796 [Xanthomendoza sp. 1 TL-2023]